MAQPFKFTAEDVDQPSLKPAPASTPFGRVLDEVLPDLGHAALAAGGRVLSNLNPITIAQGLYHLGDVLNPAKAAMLGQDLVERAKAVAAGNPEAGGQAIGDLLTGLLLPRIPQVGSVVGRGLGAVGRGAEAAGSALARPAQYVGAWQMFSRPTQAVAEMLTPQVLKLLGRGMQRTGEAITPVGPASAVGLSPADQAFQAAVRRLAERRAAIEAGEAARKAAVSPELLGHADAASRREIASLPGRMTPTERLPGPEPGPGGMTGGMSAADRARIQAKLDALKPAAPPAEGVPPRRLTPIKSPSPPAEGAPRPSLGDLSTAISQDRPAAGIAPALTSSELSRLLAWAERTIPEGLPTPNSSHGPTSNYFNGREYDTTFAGDAQTAAAKSKGRAMRAWAERKAAVAERPLPPVPEMPPTLSFSQGELDALAGKGTDPAVLQSALQKIRNEAGSARMKTMGKGTQGTTGGQAPNRDLRRVLTDTQGITTLEQAQAFQDKAPGNLALTVQTVLHRMGFPVVAK